VRCVTSTPYEGSSPFVTPQRKKKLDTTHGARPNLVLLSHEHLIGVTAFRSELRYNKDSKVKWKLGPELAAKPALRRECSANDPTAWGERSRTMVTAQLTPVGVGIHNVLIATDFSRYSNVALTFGLDLAHDYRATAYVVSVIPTDEILLAGPDAYVPAKDATRRDLLELKAELTRSHAYVEGKDYHLYMLEGAVAEAILDFACAQQIDLIVVATHGRSGLGKVLMGSVAEKVFRQSPVPVLTIGPRVHRTTYKSPTQNILVPTDFTPASERAVSYAAALARARKATLTLLHVLNPAAVKGVAARASVEQGIKTKLAELLGREADGVQCGVRVEAGRVETTILETADKIAADLLVMGVRPWNGILDRLMWPHAYEGVCQSPCPVVTVRGNSADRRISI